MRPKKPIPNKCLICGYRTGGKRKRYHAHMQTHTVDLDDLLQQIHP